MKNSSIDSTHMYNGYTIEFTYIYHPFYRGYRDSFGAPEEPDEEAHYEIEFWNIDDPKFVGKTEDEIFEILETTEEAFYEMLENVAQSDDEMSIECGKEADALNRYWNKLDDDLNS